MFLKKKLIYDIVKMTTITFIIMLVWNFFIRNGKKLLIFFTIVFFFLFFIFPIKIISKLFKNYSLTNFLRALFSRIQNTNQHSSLHKSKAQKFRLRLFGDFFLECTTMNLENSLDIKLMNITHFLGDISK